MVEVEKEDDSIEVLDSVRDFSWTCQQQKLAFLTGPTAQYYRYQNILEKSPQIIALHFV